MIIAGDLTNKPRVQWKYAIRHLSQYISPERAHIIPGNHDYYDFRIDGDDRLAAIAAAEGACFAQKAEIVIGRSRLLCCTLWTDFALHGDVSSSQSIARAKMNDYRYIRNAGAGFRKVRHAEQVVVEQQPDCAEQIRLARPILAHNRVYAFFEFHRSAGKVSVIDKLKFRYVHSSPRNVA